MWREGRPLSPTEALRQQPPAQSISQACVQEAGRAERVMGNIKTPAETHSRNCKWPLTKTRPHLLLVFEVWRQRPVPVPSNFSCWSSSAVECRETQPPARVCCQGPKAGPGDRMVLVPCNQQLSPQDKQCSRWWTAVNTQEKAEKRLLLRESASQNMKWEEDL